MRFVVKTKNVCAHVNIVNFILLMFLCTKLLHCNKLYLLLNSIKKIVYIVVDSCIFLYDKIINIAVFKEIHTHISNNSIPAIYILISIWKLCKNDFDCLPSFKWWLQY
jgi:hypothetical protein